MDTSDRRTLEPDSSADEPSGGLWRRLRPTGPPSQWVPWYLTVAGVLLIAAVVGLAAFGGFARHSFSVGPARVSAALVPAVRPGTVLGVPPFGSIRASTHVMPLALRVSLDEIDLPQLEKMATTGLPDESTVDALIAAVRAGFARAVYRGLVAALLAGAFVGWSLRRSWRATVASALVAALVPAALVIATTADFDTQAFERPTFRGAVRYAPALISLVQRRAQRVESLRSQMSKLARDLSRYYAAPQSFASAGALAGTYRVLHVTDLHLDPVGLELEKELARQFDVSLVIDTGDINHYGTPVEAAVLASQISTAVPRLFVPGNHDSTAIVAAVDGLPDVTVLGTGTVNVDGIAVFGVPDGGSGMTSTTATGQSTETPAQSAAERLRLALASGEPTPTIIALHDPTAAPGFNGLAPLLLAGHTHRPSLRRLSESWYLNSGTTGGINFSKMQPDPHVPHSASVLYYSADFPRRLIAIDQIEVFGLTAQSSVKRTIVEEAALP